MYFDMYYLVLVIPAIIVAMVAQARVRNAFKKYSTVYSKKGITGSEVARMILDYNGLNHVKIERVSGSLSDHFDPRSNVVRLSDSTYSSTSVAAIGVAAHEVGHAIQYAQNYFPIRVRAGIIPVCKIGSNLSMPIVIIGIILSFPTLIYVGIVLFSAVVVFQLVTLPVEFNASSRAMKVLESNSFLDEEELVGSRKVLSAAAMTYVAALFVSLMNLLRMILIARGGGRRRR